MKMKNNGIKVDLVSIKKHFKYQFAFRSEENNWTGYYFLVVCCR